jgi:hypothetical protein
MLSQKSFEMFKLDKLYTVRLIFTTLTIIPENVHMKIDELEE